VSTKGFLPQRVAAYLGFGIAKLTHHVHILKMNGESYWLKPQDNGRRYLKILLDLFRTVFWG
jgi:hypothetical protein